MWGLRVTAVMLTLEFLDVGLNTVNKAAMSSGFSHYILVVYSNMLAIFLLLSSSVIFYRQVFTYIGIGYSNPTLASAMIDLTPAFTFILGVISGQVLITSSLLFHCSLCRYTERKWIVYSDMGKSPGRNTAEEDKGNSNLEWSSHKIPLLGNKTVDMHLTLVNCQNNYMHFPYKGPEISHVVSIGNVHQSTREMWGLRVTAVMLTLEFLDVGLNTVNKAAMSSGFSHYILVVYSNMLAIFLLLSSSVIFYRQTWIIRDYPSEIIITLINCCFVTILSAIVTLIAEKDLNAWKIRPDIGLVAIGFSAVFAVSLRSVVHTWACHKRGPVYTSMFKPLGMAIAVFMGVSFIGDTLYLGRFHELCWQSDDAIEESGFEELPYVWAKLFGRVFMANNLFHNSTAKDPNAWILKPDVELIAILWSTVFSLSLLNVVQAWACRKKGPPLHCHV
ncbi:hypothetical protein JCGZ_21792 [Jatropha curcas]|uniref:WAT1-related protein n=1 Tax=Jatropha curcas TaxID=180498 RepID=A0A067JBW2_JATCU|nr:hypothetical protein JCGZ_21792 [Jatropha curcas]